MNHHAPTLLLLVTLSLGGALAQQKEQAAPPDVSALVAKLKSESSGERIEAARQLGALGGQARDAVAPLAEALKDDDVEVASAAAQALGELEETALPAVDALIAAYLDERIDAKGYEVGKQAARALARIGPKAVPKLIEALDSKQMRISLGAALSLYAIGPASAAAVEPLVRMIQRDDPEGRVVAIFALGGIGPAAKSAVPVLIEAARHDDFHTQYQACFTLGAIGPAAKAGVPVLLDRMENGVASVRGHAAVALGKIGPVIGQEAIDRLAARLHDPSQTVRQRAAMGLGELGPAARPKLPLLEKALDGGGLAARVDGLMAVYKIGGDRQRVTAQLFEEIVGGDEPERAADALSGFEPEAKAAVPKLIERIGSDDPLVRYNAVAALGRFGPLAKDALGPLKKLTEDPDLDVRDAAQLAIAQISGSDP